MWKKKFMNLTGQRFGRLVAIELDKEKSLSGIRNYWLCLCDCGKYKSIMTASLKNGNTKSCGCIKKERARDIRPVTNVNRFSICFPNLAKDWHPTRNGILTPNMFSYGSNDEVWWICSGCGNEWFGSIKHRKNLKENSCPSCHWLRRSKRMDNEYIEKVVNERGYELLKIRRDKRINIIIQDKNLYKYDVTFRHFTEEGRGIAIVHKGNPFSFDNIKRYLELNPKTFELCDGKYSAALEKLNFHCLKCNKQFFISWNELSSMGRGCTNCSSQSRGENSIDDFLRKNNFYFIREYKFDDCRGKQNRLPFDFAIFIKNNLYKIIEVDGLQHFEAVKHFGGEKQFIKQQEYDKIKTEYCKKNKISLLRIPYWDFDNIESVLIKELNL